MDVFHKFHNEHSQAFYLSLASQRWFTIRIDTLSVILMAFVAFLSVALSSSEFLLCQIYVVHWYVGYDVVVQSLCLMLSTLVCWL